jgi:hypothetical protein
LPLLLVGLNIIYNGRADLVSRLYAGQLLFSAVVALPKLERSGLPLKRCRIESC